MKNRNKALEAAWASYQKAQNAANNWFPTSNYVKNQNSKAMARLANRNANSRLKIWSLFGTNPAKINPLQRVTGSDLYLDQISTTMTTAAGNQLRIVNQLPMKTWFDIFNTQEDAVPDVKEMNIVWDFHSDYPFIIIPFVTTVETAGSIASTDVADSNYLVGIQTAIAGTEGSFEVLGEIHSHLNPDYGANGYQYTALVQLDLTQKVRKYFDHCSRKEFEGEDPKSFFFGLVYRAQENKTVTLNGWNKFVVGQRRRKPNLAI